ncbi:hypothetical protein HOLleu_11986 [Holothuria leucospilota]|uniref:Uncharacterized protein n=1 Tax=Holothuria leucospilota TaxID=206669 RepID=A0A9Q0YBY7_HOLLE|nr:hypothetical protein HOLleu_44933 [Holothuria leucospilota]KAJ8041234.1 hypothetical protein HOLleu_11986 [Holothuria leucospilota]
MAEFRQSRELEDFQFPGERKIRTERKKEQTIKRGWQCGGETERQLSPGPDVNFSSLSITEVFFMEDFLL